MSILNIPGNLIKKYSKAEKSIYSLKIGEGGVVDDNGNKLAVYREGEKEFVKLNPFCTHMGCQVGWNKEESTWDCPCHGAKFDKNGKVLKGPAQKDLEKIN